jgi:hypothetical protein
VKNVTLSIDDRLLENARAYAERNGNTLNSLIRDLLKKTVEPSTDGLTELWLWADRKGLRSSQGALKREDLYGG